MVIKKRMEMGIRMVALCQIYAVEKKVADFYGAAAHRRSRFPFMDSVGHRLRWRRCLCLHIQTLHMAGLLLLGDDFARIELY